jgi:hypothetical protein
LDGSWSQKRPAARKKNNKKKKKKKKKKKEKKKKTKSPHLSFLCLIGVRIGALVRSSRLPAQGYVELFA